MWFSENFFLTFLIFNLFLVLRVNCHINGTSLICLLRVNDSEMCDGVNEIEYQTELSILFDDVPHTIHKKLLLGSLANLTTEEIIQLPINLLYFLPINKLGVLSGTHLATLLITHEDDSAIAEKILQSILNDQQRSEFLNCLVPKVITNYKTLNIISETVYKWNYDVRDGKFRKLSNICGYALARLWAPYVLTRTKPITTRLLTLLAEVEQKQSHKILCNKYTQTNWKNLPKNIRRLWSFLAVNQSYPRSLNQWTIEQIDQYKFLLPDFNNDELSLIPFDELSKMALHDIDFDNSQARFLFNILLGSSTLKDVKIFYPTFFYKLSPLQINQFEPEEWTNEKSAISSMENIYFSYATAKQIFNKIASDWLSTKKNVTFGWTSDDLRHLPLFYTQPVTSFLKFCFIPPSVQSLIAVDSYMLTDRQAFYLSGCSSVLTFHKNDPKFLLGLRYMIKAIPVSSLLNIDTGSISLKVASHLVSLVNNHNLPMALHLLNITNPVKNINFIEEMLKNEHNILFEQLAPSDISGPIFDVLQQLYSNYTDRIDKLPKHILSVILESNELLIKWTGNESIVNNGLFNGYTCNFIKKLNNANLIVLISHYNVYLKRNDKVFPKNLQICVAEAFINYLKLKSKFSADLSTSFHLEAWEIEAVQGFVLTTLPVDVILNSILRDKILYAIGKLSFPELLIASPPEKLSLMVEKYITHILKNGSNLNYEHLYTLGNLTHFIPAAYLSLVNEHAFKFIIEAGLFDTRLCADSTSKCKWADLIIKAFGTQEHWSSDTLVTLSDLLIVFNRDQLDSIPIMSRLDSADIIRTSYADEIEWKSNNIPFYKGCVSILGDEFMNFTNSLSDLINFHLASMQNQLQMISPINHNHNYKEILKSSEAKTKIFKPTALIPFPKTFNVDSSSPANNLLKTFFLGKDKKYVNENTHYNTNESIQSTITPETNEFISSFPNSQNISIVAHLLLPNNTDSYNKISNKNISLNMKINNDLNKQLTSDDTKLNVNMINFQENSSFSSIIVVENSTSASLLPRNKYNDNFKTYVYNIIPNKSISLEIDEISTATMGHKRSKESHKGRQIRSLEIFFNSSVQIGCDALKMLGPSSVASVQFGSIIRSMSNEELEDCVDLIGSFNINTELAKYIWSKIKEKGALHTYGSVLSGLTVDDIKTLDLDITNPWSLELINLLSKYIKTNDIRKEIIRQFMINSKANIPSHLWGSFGSLICQLQPRTFKIIMPNKEYFWKISPAFNAIKTCDDMSCIKNLASIAVSVVGQSSLWKTAEVERMGIILSGINITQWQLLLNHNSEALEGLTPIAIKCLNKSQIKLINNSHMKYLTPKSAHTLLETHSKLLDVQSKETLQKLIHFEIKVEQLASNWKPIPASVKPKIFEHKYSVDNHTQTIGIHAFESTNIMSSHEMQADSSHVVMADLSHKMLASSRATTNHILPFSFLCVLLFVLN